MVLKSSSGAWFTTLGCAHLQFGSTHVHLLRNRHCLRGRSISEKEVYKVLITLEEGTYATIESVSSSFWGKRTIALLSLINFSLLYVSDESVTELDGLTFELAELLPGLLGLDGGLFIGGRGTLKPFSMELKKQQQITYLSIQGEFTVISFYRITVHYVFINV